MHRHSIPAFALAVLILPLRGTAAAAQEGAAPNAQKVQSPETAKVGTSNGQPATVKIEAENWKALDDIKTGLRPRPSFLVETDEQPDFVREYVRLQWRPDDEIDLLVMRPKTKEKVPVILYLYSYPSETDRFRDDGWCVRATKDGYAAVGFVSALTGHRYHTRPMKEWFVSELQESLGSTVHDVQLILNYLADRGDMDLNRAGMFGQGSGGAIAILAAQVDARIKAVDVLDPWGDWPDWLKESPLVPEAERPRYVKEDFLKTVGGLDPINSLPNLKAQAVRVQQTLTETVTPKSAKERIGAAVSADPKKVEFVRYANVEEHRKAWQVSGLSGWIKKQLQPLAKTETTSSPEGQEQKPEIRSQLAP